MVNQLKFLIQIGFRPLFFYTFYKLGLLTGYYQTLTPPGALKRAVPPTHSLFSLPDQEKIRLTLGEAGQSMLLEDAKTIIEGKFKRFGSQPVEISLSGDWPALHWTYFETARANLHTKNQDIKFLWEPARFGWVYALGRAYHLTGDPHYAEGFWNLFEIFHAANPANIGPNWMNGQEVAIRLISLVWASHVFKTALSSTPARQALLHASIFQHACRIPPTLVYARAQNNNHLVTEAAAMVTAGLFFNNKRWHQAGWKWLNWAFQNQIDDHGEYIQHSINYHRLMLQTALWVRLIKRHDFPEKTCTALGRSTSYLLSLLDETSGMTPNLGANDGALLFPLSSSDYEDFRPVAQAASCAFLNSRLPSGAWDEMSLWFANDAMQFPQGAACAGANRLNGEDSWAYLRASQFKSRLSHIDQLSLDLWWRGINLAQDAGTYLYNASPPWDNPLVSTRVHNTVMVDECDQMTRAGRFMTLDWRNASILSTPKSNDLKPEELHARLVHHGICHARTVTVLNGRHWQVEDQLTPRSLSSHTYRLHWLLPDAPWEILDQHERLDFQIHLPVGSIQVFISTPALDPSARKVSLVRAGKLQHGQREIHPYEGWVSRRYGEKYPALSLAVDVTSEFPVKFLTEFILPN